MRREKPTPVVPWQGKTIWRGTKGWRDYDDRRAWVMFAITLVMLAVFAVHDETRARQIANQRDEDRAANYTQCLSRSANNRHYNETQDALAKVERTNRFVDQAIRDARIAAYQKAKLIVIDCSPLRPEGTPVPTPTATP